MSNVSSPLRIVQTDFRAGEVQPSLAMRVDSKMYPAGASSLLNCQIKASGAVKRRPGFSKVTTMTGYSRRRLISFECDIDERYIFAFTASALEIYTLYGQKLVTFTSVPWTTDTIVSEITMTQAGETMIVCHSSFKPRVIRRTSLTAFSISEFEFERSSDNRRIYQPYMKYTTAAVTVAVDTGSSFILPEAGVAVNVYSNGGIFSADQVGERIRVWGKEIEITAFVSVTQVQGIARDAVFKRLDPNPINCTDGTYKVEITHAFHGLSTGAVVYIEGAPDEPLAGDTNGMLKSQVNGWRTITVTDDDHYMFTTTGQPAKDTLDYGGSNIKVWTNGGTREWEEPTFSTRRGWPSACCFHEDRLWFGGSASVPDGLWSSRTGNYFNFSVGDGEDDASIQLTVGSPRIARIRHILAGRVLQIFTEGAEFVARQSDGVGLTPSTTSIRPQTPFGCSLVRPRAFDGATIFVQSNGKTVREFTYDFGTDGFQSVDLTTLSSHLIRSVVSFDVLYGSATQTEQYAFFVNSDGTMAVLHSNRAEGMAGWTPWVLGGSAIVESVCAVMDQVFISATYNNVRYLLKLELDNPDSTLDFSSTLTVTNAATAWQVGSGFSGKFVNVTSIGWSLGKFQVSPSNAITLPTAVKQIQVGLDYEWRVVPLPPDTTMPDGMMTGVKRRISSATVHVLDTLDLNIDGRSVVTTTIGSDLSVPPAPISRKVRRFLMGYDRDPVVTLTQSHPLPVTVLGLSLEVSL